MMNHNHPFHLLTLSPWPILNSFCLMNLMLSIIIWFFFNEMIFFMFNTLLLLLFMFQWWRDIIRESTFQGFHTFYIMKLMKISMILFIISEFFFFISFFWTLFHSSISPSIEINMIWPPKYILTFNPYDIPLLNSLILIYSGMILTWSHYSILNNKFKKSKILLLITILLGMYFSSLQYIEYKQSYFCMNDSIYGSIFFLMTGFHGIHVLIGIMMLMTCFIRITNYHFSTMHHFNFEAASWYWHFVDVVWLFLYIFIYWWN